MDSRVRLYAREFLCALLDLLYPRRCASCDRYIEALDNSHICRECMSRMPFIDPDQACLRCGLSLGPFADDHDGRYCEGCASVPLVGFNRTVAVGTYDGPLRASICAFKYGRRRHLDRVLGSLVASQASAAWEDDLPDALIPVPLHPARRRERTFDQALLLARAVGDQTGIRVIGNALRRTVDTPTLTHQTRQQRLETVTGAFASTARLDVKGLSIGLIDDVMTTGATASECARIIRKAGAREVRVLVLARTP